MGNEFFLLQLVVPGEVEWSNENAAALEALQKGRYDEAARSFSANRAQIFTKVLIPSALPFIVAGLRLGIGRGLVGVVVGEFIGARAGLGYMIFRSSQGFQIDAMWVGVFLLAGTGVVAVIILQNVERRMAPWRQFELK